MTLVVHGDIFIYLKCSLIGENFEKFHPRLNNAKMANGFDQNHFDNVRINNVIILICGQIFLAEKFRFENFDECSL